LPLPLLRRRVGPARHRRRGRVSRAHALLVGRLAQHVAAAREDESVVDRRLLDAAQLAVVEVDDCVGPLLEPERGRALVGAEAEQGVERDHAALPGLPARDALELAQLLEWVDAHVRVAPDAHADRSVAYAR